MDQNSKLSEIQRKLAVATSVTVLTGAGISADSGVPTFRGEDGLWKNFRPEELASPEAFERDPRLVWEWYNWRRELLATKSPNPAHQALAKMEQQFEQFWLITQNVDGLHQAAGTERLSEIHGNIWKVRCTSCGRIEENRTIPLIFPPTCTQCQSLLRPHIVWFGESLDPQNLEESYKALHHCDILLIVGTSGIVYPAASFGPVAKSSGAFIVEINLDSQAPSDFVDIALQGRAKDIVPSLLT